MARRRSSWLWEPHCRANDQTISGCVSTKSPTSIIACHRSSRAPSGAGTPGSRLSARTMACSTVILVRSSSFVWLPYRRSLTLPLHQVPFVAVEVEEGDYQTVRFLAWFVSEGDAVGFHMVIVVPKISGVKTLPPVWLPMSSCYSGFAAFLQMKLRYRLLKRRFLILLFRKHTTFFRERRNQPFYPVK
jgi:hypothetical protein